MYKEAKLPAALRKLAPSSGGELSSFVKERMARYRAGRAASAAGGGSAVSHPLDKATAKRWASHAAKRGAPTVEAKEISRNRSVFTQRAGGMDPGLLPVVSSKGVSGRQAHLNELKSRIKNKNLGVAQAPMAGSRTPAALHPMAGTAVAKRIIPVPPLGPAPTPRIGSSKPKNQLFKARSQFTPYAGAN